LKKWGKIVTMVQENQENEAGRFFDTRINLTAVLTLITLVCSAAFTLAKYEPREAHDQDMQRLNEIYQRKDISAMTDKELRDWMARIESKLDTLQRTK